MPDIFSLAPNALTTAETVRALLQLQPEEYPVLPLLINAASAWVETQTDRRFALREYTERYAASGSQKLVLNQYPIVSVEYVRDLNGGVISSAEYDFSCTAEEGILFKESCWPYRGYGSGLANDITTLSRYLEVRYQAGYVLPKDAADDRPRTLPYDLESLVWEIVEQELTLRQNGAQGLSAFSISDVSWTFDKQPRQSWIDTIKQYKRW